MLPTFPSYTRISVSDKRLIESYVYDFIPYSDYNFTSLFVYDTDGDYEVSQLNGNLVVLFRDYVTRERFFSFIGMRHVIETASLLISRSRELHLNEQLRLIPSFVIEKSNIDSEFIIEEDRDNFDYILSLESIARLNEKELRNKRRLLLKFRSDNTHTIKMVDLQNKICQREILAVFSHWQDEQVEERTTEEDTTEKRALEKLLAYSHSLNLICLGSYVDRVMVGFAIVEKVQKGYAIGHFMKSLHNSYAGISEALYHGLANELIRLNCRYLNIEQDFGHPGLRRAKLLWRPVGFLEKYVIKPKSNLASQ